MGVLILCKTAIIQSFLCNRLRVLFENEYFFESNNTVYTVVPEFASNGHFAAYMTQYRIFSKAPTLLKFNDC